MKRHTESFVEELRFEASPKPSFYNMIERGTFPQGQGTVLSTFQIARSLPTTDEPGFVPITTNMPNNCETEFNNVPVGYFEKTFRPEQFGWKDPVICQDNLYFDWNRTKFLDGYMRAMKKNVTWTIENRLAAIYDHLVPKGVANTDFSFTEPGTGFPGTGPDLTLDRSECELTQEMLDETAAILEEEGATEGPYSDGWVDWGEAGPVFTLQIGLKHSARLLKLNSELRLDYRYAQAGRGGEDGQGSTILKRLGASKTIGNFRHLVTQFPPRYNYVDGDYVRVATWVDDPSTTKGDGVKINPEWRVADFEGARVLNPFVFRSLVIPPLSSAGGDTHWSPKSYMGEWQFVTGGNKIAADNVCFDPLEKLGQHFAEYKHAPEPISPKHGRLLIFRRCVDDLECISCAGS